MVRFDDFVTGLVNNNKAHFGRLVGLVVHKDGTHESGEGFKVGVIVMRREFKYFDALRNWI